MVLIVIPKLGVWAVTPVDIIFLDRIYYFICAEIFESIKHEMSILSKVNKNQPIQISHKNLAHVPTLMMMMIGDHCTIVFVANHLTVVIHLLYYIQSFILATCNLSYYMQSFTLHAFF